MTASPSTAPSPAAPDPRGTDPRRTDASIGDLVTTVLTESSNLIRRELELAKLELTDSVKKVGIGIAMFVVAAALILFSLIFGFFALAEGINALGLSRWLAFLIVFAFQLAVVVALLLLGRTFISKRKKPEQTMRTARETVDYLKTSRTS